MAHFSALPLWKIFRMPLHFLHFQLLNNPDHVLVLESKEYFTHLRHAGLQHRPADCNISLLNARVQRHNGYNCVLFCVRIRCSREGGYTVIVDDIFHLTYCTKFDQISVHYCKFFSFTNQSYPKLVPISRCFPYCLFLLVNVLSQGSSELFRHINCFLDT
jgi:hypothetical protein